MRLKEVVFPVPFQGPDRQRQNSSYIHPLHKINKELWPRAGTTQDFSPPLEAALSGLSRGTL